MRSNGKLGANFAINKGLIRAKSVSVVLGIAEFRLHEFNDVNIATAFNQIAHLQGGPMDLRVRLLEQRALRIFESQKADFSPRSLAMVIYAMAVLRLNSAIFESLCNASHAKLQDFNAQDLANTLWAMAKTGTQMPDVFEALCTAAARKLQDFNAQGLANTLWAMAKTGTQMPEVFEALCTEAAQKVQDFNAQNVASTP